MGQDRHGVFGNPKAIVSTLVLFCLMLFSSAPCARTRSPQATESSRGRSLPTGRVPPPRHLEAALRDRLVDLALILPTPLGPLSVRPHHALSARSRSSFDLTGKPISFRLGSIGPLSSFLRDPLGGISTLQVCITLIDVLALDFSDIGGRGQDARTLG